jgi:hypothetical protein
MGSPASLLLWRAFFQVSGLLAIVRTQRLADLVLSVAAIRFDRALVIVGSHLLSYWFSGLLHSFIGERTPALVGEPLRR